MSYLVVLIVDDINDCPAILTSLEEAGITGVTILNSTGLGRIRRAGLRDDVPLLPSLNDLFNGEEVQHRTLLSVVENEAKVDLIIQVAQQVIGDLDGPHTGFLFVIPVVKALGLGKHYLK